MRVLLIQVRHDEDPMVSHEARCVATRLGERTDLATVSALGRRAEASWVDGFDAVVIGGSGDFSVHDPRSEPWVAGLRDVVERLLERKVPAFGICFGHQLLAHHLGTAVATVDDQAELGTVPVRLTNAGRADPVFGVMTTSFDVHTGHSDHVTAIPPELELMAEGSRCAHQAFRHRAAPFFTTQFHPDLTGAEAIERYLGYRRHLTPAEAAEASARFKPGADAAGRILGAFIAHAATMAE
jgi:GMP synthase (glutamine-hydrolysing)